MTLARLPRGCGALGSRSGQALSHPTCEFFAINQRRRAGIYLLEPAQKLAVPCLCDARVGRSIQAGHQVMSELGPLGRRELESFMA